MVAETPSPFWKRLGWFIAIWLMSILALGTVAGIIRWWLRP